LTIPEIAIMAALEPTRFRLVKGEEPMRFARFRLVIAVISAEL